MYTPPAIAFVLAFGIIRASLSYGAAVQSKTSDISSRATAPNLVPLVGATTEPSAKFEELEKRVCTCGKPSKIVSTGQCKKCYDQQRRAAGGHKKTKTCVTCKETKKDVFRNGRCNKCAESARYHGAGPEFRQYNPEGREDDSPSPQGEGSLQLSTPFPQGNPFPPPQRHDSIPPHNPHADSPSPPPQRAGSVHLSDPWGRGGPPPTPQRSGSVHLYDPHAQGPYAQGGPPPTPQRAASVHLYDPYAQGGPPPTPHRAGSVHLHDPYAQGPYAQGGPPPTPRRAASVHLHDPYAQGPYAQGGPPPTPHRAGSVHLHDPYAQGPYAQGGPPPTPRRAASVHLYDPYAQGPHARGGPPPTPQRAGSVHLHDPYAPNPPPGQQFPNQLVPLLPPQPPEFNMDDDYEEMFGQPGYGMPQFPPPRGGGPRHY